MTSNTPNWSLVKADGSDTVNLASHITGNMDIIDGKVDASTTRDIDFRKHVNGVSISPSLTSASHTFSRKLEILVGDTVSAIGRFGYGGAASGTLVLTLPFSMTWTGTARYVGEATAYDSSANTVFMGALILASATTCNIAGTNGTGLWNATTPFTWASNDVFGYNLLVEI